MRYQKPFIPQCRLTITLKSWWVSKKPLNEQRSCIQNKKTLSIHHTSKGFFPPSPHASLPTSPSSTPFDPFTLSIPLKPGASPQTYLRIWPIIERIVNHIFLPDFLIIQCGVDALAGDPCATFNWCLDREVAGSLGWCVQRVVREWKGKKLLLGGGKSVPPRIEWSRFVHSQKIKKVDTTHQTQLEHGLTWLRSPFVVF